MHINSTNPIIARCSGGGNVRAWLSPAHFTDDPLMACVGVGAWQARTQPLTQYTRTCNRTRSVGLKPHPPPHPRQGLDSLTITYEFIPVNQKNADVLVVLDDRPGWR